MKNIRLATCSLFAFLMLHTSYAQAPVITAATPVATTVERWGKFEVQLSITANWTNPYDYDEIRVNAVFTDPDGQAHPVEGFFMQDYQLNTQTGVLTAVGSGAFRVRFAPDKTGTWKYVLSCTNASGTGTFAEKTFQVTAAQSAKNKGFVRSDQTNYLHFDSGDPYIPVGENIGWQNGNIYTDYQKWLTKLGDNGGNFFRLWHCSWGLGIEWKNGNSGFSGLRKYKQTSAFYQDWMFDFCAERGIYLMLCLHHHGQVSSQVNPNWSDSPYNAVNGGPCPNTWDFFTNASAKNHVKNRLRYVLARWGYARSVMSWELFNEVDWTDQFDQRKGDVANWHSEMATFLKARDPHQHLVTSSYADEQYDPNVWNQPNIDFTQTHYYVNTPNLERVFVSGIRHYLEDFGKPTLNGEFGLNTDGTGLITLDPTGISIHNALFATLFGGGMGSGATWWWDNYVEPQNLYYRFAPVSAVADKVPFRSGNFAPVQATVSGVPGDLVLTPTVQGWGALADTSITINANGTITPAGAGLGAFLYGSQWNTQFRRPPVFKVTYPAAGQFSVKTSGQTGQAPKIAIWLDGVKKLEQSAAVNQTYTIAVPPGQHILRVDNTGTDWILIAGYNFSGLGSAVDAYVLKSANQDKVAGWVLNNRYNHDFLKTIGNPPPAQGAILTVPDMKNGTYTVKYYDCLTGALAAVAPVTIANNTLTLALPAMLWDAAFLVEDGWVSTAEAIGILPVSLYPNPVTTGLLTIALALEKPENVVISLLDVAGRELVPLFTGEFVNGQQQVQIPATCPAGLYWVKVVGAGMVGVKPVVVARP